MGFRRSTFAQLLTLIIGETSYLTGRLLVSTVWNMSSCSCLHLLPTSAFSFQSWSLSPEITRCFLNDSITVGVMRGHEKWNTFFVLSLPSEAGTERKLWNSWWVSGWWLWFAGPNRKTTNSIWKSIDGAHEYTLTHLMAKDWKALMEETRERLPLCAAPRQTMACASADGRAGRRSSGLNRLQCFMPWASDTTEAQLALPGKGCRARRASIAGVLDWRKAKRGRLKSELVLKWSDSCVCVCVERWAVAGVLWECGGFDLCFPHFICFSRTLIPHLCQHIT